MISNQISLVKETQVLEYQGSYFIQDFAHLLRETIQLKHRYFAKMHASREN